ncbi:NifU family protein [Garciella nitratireducens]|uniref:NifU family protein n=1 Tax=Garciella nitratireducens TaxID=218205 RepID=UPI001BD69BD3|nr:NifU family protein [Garciella nitratireducens]
MEKKLKKILQKEIRPYLLKHDGDMEVLFYEDGILGIRLLGQCKNCPSAKFTVEDIIESTLKEYIPDLKKVILRDDVSEELYQFAKELLSKNK